MFRAPRAGGPARHLLHILALIAGLSCAPGFLIHQDHEADPAEAAKEMADVGADSLPAVDLIIVVPSHSAVDADRRQAVRDSWAQYLNKTAVNCTPCDSHKIKIVFVVGKSNETAVAAEMKEYGDIGLLEDFAQPEHGGEAEMTQRTIRYAQEHFKFKLLLKVDTHSWVFMDRLLNFLESKELFNMNASQPGVYIGNFAGPLDPALQDDNSLDDVFFQLTGSAFYPMYAKGAGFLLSPDLCEFISGMGAASEDTSGAPTWGAEYGWAPVPRLASLPHDEVSVGFWLLPVNHTKVHMPVAIGNEACKAGPKDIVLDHGMDATTMLQRWQNFLNTGDICAETPPEVSRATAHSLVISTTPKPEAKDTFLHKKDHKGKKAATS